MYGDLDLNSVSGGINVRNHYGNITSKTVSGDLTASGEIMKFSSNSVSGNVYLDVSGTPDSVNIKSVSGDITLRLEPGVPAEYKVSSMSGRLQLDDASITVIRGQYMGKFGDLHGQWLEFAASTVSGDVAVLHSRESGGSGR